MVTAQRYDSGQLLAVSVPEWLRAQNMLASRDLVGYVKRETDKAILFTGTVSLRPAEYCHRCGRFIDNPVSRMVGYGPICSGEIGIDRPDLSKEEMAAFIAKISTKRPQYELWLPKRMIKVAPASADETVNIKTVEVEVPPDFTFSAARMGNEHVLNIRVKFELKDAVKSCGGRWNPEAKVWYIPANAGSLRHLWETIQTQKWTVKDTDGQWSTITKDFSGIATDVRDGETAPNIPGLNKQAWRHQRNGFAFVRHIWGEPDEHRNAAAAYFYDMGAGKTLPSLGLIRYYGFRRVLIVGPKSVIETQVWQKDAKKHYPDFKATFVALGGGTSKSLDLLNVHRLDVGTVVFLINYDALGRERTAEQKQLNQTLLNYGFDAVVFDEIHRLKSPGGKTSRFCQELSKRVPKRLGLTGTPQPRNPLDIYAQYRALDTSIFGTSFARFRDRYAIMGGYGGYEIQGWQNLPELSERMYQIAHRVTIEDTEIELPEAVHIDRTFALSPRAQKVYNALQEDFIAYLDSGSVTTSNTLVKLLRLQQITGGWLPLDKAENDPDAVQEYERIDTGKYDTLVDILEDLPQHEPVVVFARFKAELDDIREACEKTERTCGELSGRKRDIVAWQDGKFDVLAVQIQSGGTGIDLTRARYAIYLSTGFSNGDFEQSLKRVHRPGQTRNTTYIHVNAEDTIDEIVAASLAQKADLAKLVVDTLRGKVNPQKSRIDSLYQE